MINIEKTARPSADFHSLVGTATASDPVEAFALEGNATRLSSPSTDTPTLLFSTKDPTIRLSDRRGKFSDAERDNILCLLASPDGRFGSLTINANAQIYTCALGAGHQITYRIPRSQHLWLRPDHGELTVNSHQLDPNKFATISEEKEITLTALSDSQFLMVVLWD